MRSRWLLGIVVLLALVQAVRYKLTHTVKPSIPAISAGMSGKRDAEIADRKRQALDRSRIGTNLPYERSAADTLTYERSQGSARHPNRSRSQGE